MRAICLVALLVGCGPSERKFEEDFHAKLCEVLATDECGNLECPPIGEKPPPPEGCDYDASTARECLGGAWACVAFPASPWPQACDEVYVCDETTE